MKRLLIKLLFILSKVPAIEGAVDPRKEQEMFWGIYPTKEFRDYVARRDLQILQILGEGVSRDDYISLLGQRMELQKLLQYAKQSFEAVENRRKQK